MKALMGRLILMLISLLAMFLLLSWGHPNIEDWQSFACYFLLATMYQVKKAYPNQKKKVYLLAGVVGCLLLGLEIYSHIEDIKIGFELGYQAAQK